MLILYMTIPFPDPCQNGVLRWNLEHSQILSRIQNQRKQREAGNKHGWITTQQQHNHMTLSDLSLASYYWVGKHCSHPKNGLIRIDCYQHLLLHFAGMETQPDLQSLELQELKYIELWPFLKWIENINTEILIKDFSHYITDMSKGSLNNCFT